MEHWDVREQCLAEGSKHLWLSQPGVLWSWESGVPQLCHRMPETLGASRDD